MARISWWALALAVGVAPSPVAWATPDVESGAAPTSSKPSLPAQPAPGLLPSEAGAIVAPAINPTAEEEPGAQESAARIRKVREDRERRGVALAIKASTLGIGLEGIYSIGRHVNVRGQVNLLNLNHTLNKDGNDYQGQIKFLTAGILGDFYPFARVPVAGAFRLTAGAYDSQNKVNLNTRCGTRTSNSNGCSIGNITIYSTNSSNPASLNGQLAFNHFSPYGGIGFGNAMQGGRLHFAFDLGVLFDSNPTVNLQANGDVAAYRSNSATPFYTGPASGNRIVTTNVSMEGKNLQGDFKNYQIYPVIAFTIGYRFGI